MSNPAISYAHITRVTDTLATATQDALAAEEPLEIRLVHNNQQESITVTMRSPGQDAELAAGFLFTEGIITRYDAIQSIVYNDNIATVTLQAGIRPSLQAAQRNFLANSSCGVCGKTELDAIYAPVNKNTSDIKIPAGILHDLPAKLRMQQAVFDNTGGLHAAALFNTGGKLFHLREDIGRHNAVDKLIGAAWQQGLSFGEFGLLLSGRAGFELIQKAAVAGIPLIAAVGAPSSMAVKVAKEWDIALIGFLREGRFNIYHGEERIEL
ncbi:formate dehydrogenase accessory sulfurtransferase FdhD [Chitinophaga sancti]|uniref:Sulfur carrier protein FdhD n=1 Tax=Chitinophaga sancti TaxID=1004 RepID=A0A1K1NB65_9BACT|nr:formate dehydrogenase accessory sulfurtransferase FdhD [Chitinophaga sancti]WQD63378.1 formate dehydrogenase accessory sulfurtransferase FdhD [Chitinophaga sancti]WQG90996.1 formate dehydrogenase accessory sulfurtransferase FdhD [Chitinophaga sancti]SFW32674.1 FdhD protein [Chitinophaga sancti]